MAKRYLQARPHHARSLGSFSGHLNGVSPINSELDRCNGGEMPADDPACCQGPSAARPFGCRGRTSASCSRGIVRRDLLGRLERSFRVPVDNELGLIAVERPGWAREVDPVMHHRLMLCGVDTLRHDLRNEFRRLHHCCRDAPRCRRDAACRVGQDSPQWLRWAQDSSHNGY